MANNVVVIAAYALFWWLRKDAGPWPDDALSGLEVTVLAGGTTLGVVALTAVPLLALARRGVRLRPRWTPRDADVRRLGRHGGWATGQVVAMQGLLVVVLVLSNAVAGGVVAFQYGTTFFLLPVALVAIPITTAVYPALSRATADEFPAALGRATVAVTALLVPAVAALAALAWPIVRVTAFGQAADAGLGTLVAAVAWLAPGALGYGLVLLFTRALYARGDTRTPALALGAALAVAAGVMVAWAPDDAEARLAVLAGVQSAGYLAAAGLLAWHLARSTSTRGGGRPLDVLRTLAAGAAAAAVMVSIAAVIDPEGRLASLVVIAVAAGAGGAVYVAVLQATGRGLRDLVRLEPSRG
jgi:putative peptidoglycan lipid II flippase